MHQQRIYIFLIGLSCFLYGNGWAQSTAFILHEDNATHAINDAFMVYEDHTAALPFQAIQQLQNDQFNPLENIAKPLNQESAYWLTVELNHQANQTKKWVLTTSETDRVSLYFFDHHQKLQTLQTGKLVPYTERNIKEGKPHLCQFQFELAPEQTTQIWLRFYSPTKSLKGLETTIYTLEKWKLYQYENYYARQLIIGIFLGFLGIMFLYTFTNYLLVKDQIYLYYSLYIFGPLLYLLNYEGLFLQKLIGDYPLLYLYIRVLTPSFSIIGYLAFTRSFLKTSTLIPKWDKVFQGLIALELLLIAYLCIVIQFQLNVFLFQSIPVTFHIIVLFCTFLLSFTLLKDNQSLTRYFVLGAAAYTLSTISLNYIAISKSLALNIGLLIQAVGLVIELVSFSIGLGYRVKLNEEEKRNIEAENARILREQNLLLEQQVAERTQEINTQKKEIEMQAEKLQMTNERLMELSDFKQSMTNMIVHDLKNPLASIIHTTQDASIKQNSLRMLNLVMNILDIDKMEATEIPIRWHRHQLTKVVREAVEQVAVLMEHKNINFSTSLPNFVLIYADYELIVRVLVNLLTNAIKFTPVNGSITIEAEQLTETCLQVSITNTGKGIPQAKIESLFDKYSQLEVRKSGGVRASGLGLTFCKLVLEAHDCEISAQSAEDGPTTFWFTIPMRKEKTTATRQKTTQSIVELEKKPTLSTCDKTIIEPQLAKLVHLEVFDYSEIQEVLAEITADSACIQQWKKEIMQAISVCNQERYQELVS